LNRKFGFVLLCHAGIQKIPSQRHLSFYDTDEAEAAVKLVAFGVWHIEEAICKISVSRNWKQVYSDVLVRSWFANADLVILNQLVIQQFEKPGVFYWACPSADQLFVFFVIVKVLNHF
jgi:hypothetical protein